MIEKDIYVLGEVEKIFYESPANYFKILLISIENTDSKKYFKSTIVVTGEFSEIVEGDSYKFYGSLVENSKYGLQMQSGRYERGALSRAGFIKYLSSGRFKGIGMKKAIAIYDLYGADTVSKILKAPEKLCNIPRMTKKQREDFIKILKADTKKETTLSHLYELGVPHTLALKIEDEHGEAALNLIQENPYMFCRTIKGYSFTIADNIAFRLGIEWDSPLRVSAAITHSLNEHCNKTGDTYMLRDDLVKECVALLQKTKKGEVLSDLTKLVEDGLITLLEYKHLRNVKDKIFTKSFFSAEEGVAKSVNNLLKNSEVYPFKEDDVLSEIEAFEKKKDPYDPIQKSAIIGLMNSPFFILTGGPGTGKTTVIEGIVEVYKKLHKKVGNDPKILLAAPTGRASRRLGDAVKMASATLHSHLGLPNNYIEEDLEADLIVIDEFSMVDTWMANKLFQRISLGTQVLIVGDAGQLPSVAPGNVLSDLLRVEAIPKVKLEKVFRQSDDSTIVTLAADIRQGIMTPDFINKKADRSYFEVNRSQIVEFAKVIVQRAMSSGIDKDEIQVLAPMYKGDGGINNLNIVLQEIINPKEQNKIEFTYRNQMYREGDRVIQLENKSDLGVYNGDTGKIIDLIPSNFAESGEDELVIMFDSAEVIYKRSDWNYITLAYAMSIHKSQGSEFPVVIMPVTMANYPMLQRNLIYTGVTRAKKSLILLGEYSAFEQAIKHVGVDRKTYLVEQFLHLE